MMRSSLAFAFSLLALVAAQTADAKDQSRLPVQVAQTQPGTSTETPAVPLPVPAPVAQPETPPPPAPPVPDGEQPQQGEDLTQPDPNQPNAGTDETMPPDDLSLGEIPEIQTMELTVDIAKRAIDSYSLVKSKYESADLESYENLQDFVDQNAEGKNFEGDIKTAGFANVNDWNLAITTLGFAYTGVTDDQSADISQQINEIQADNQLAQDMKDRMIASLKAMIPSENNKKVVQEMMKEPAYVEKLKLLDIEEE